MIEEKRKKEWATWNLKVPRYLDNNLEEYIEIDSFATKAEFIREAVRRTLEEEHEKLRVKGKEKVEAVE